MTREEAKNMLFNACGQMNIALAVHQQLQEAIKVLSKDNGKDKPKPNAKKDK